MKSGRGDARRNTSSRTKFPQEENKIGSRIVQIWRERSAGKQSPWRQDPDNYAETSPRTLSHKHETNPWAVNLLEAGALERKSNEEKHNFTRKINRARLKNPGKQSEEKQNAQHKIKIISP
jgi:hypothetical protein